jgi:Asp-tRNA(Asn)/Glu-tRNA(Gln) amidotransferase A subunit family amidase
MMCENMLLCSPGSRGCVLLRGGVSVRSGSLPDDRRVSRPAGPAPSVPQQNADLRRVTPDVRPRRGAGHPATVWGGAVRSWPSATADADETLPMPTSVSEPSRSPDLPARSARHLAALVEAGALAPDALARATLARIGAENPALRAFVALLGADDAAAQARQLRGPLAGVPVAVKDIFDTRDLPTAYGSPIYPAQPARVDAAAVAALRRAGGLVIGKSSTTEFAFLEPTATTNPRAPGRTPGGSSAGSAAAVAAGLVPLALGTQTGGSVIRPASYCGVVGYKPSFGSLPTAGLKCFSWSLDTVGLFARDVADVAWFAHALCGRALALGEAPPDRPFVVGVPDAYPWPGLSANAAAAVETACDAMQAAGVQIRRCSLPAWAGAAFEAHADIQGFEAWRCLRWEFEEHRQRLSPVLRDYLQGTSDIGAAAYEAAQVLATAARADTPAWFAGLDAVLTPSAPDEAPLGHHSTGPSTFNRLWTLLGGPCISVPGLLGDHGAPMGLQLVAPPGADARLLAVAQRLEQALGLHAVRETPGLA